MKPIKNVVWFKDIDLQDVKQVGGKNMSLGGNCFLELS